MRLIWIALVLTACSSSNSSKPDAPPGTIDAPATVDGPPDAPATSGKSGLIMLSQFYAGTTHLVGATARFALTSVYGDAIGSSGGCTMYHNLPQTGISAGTITVTGTTTPITLTPTGSPPTYDHGALPIQLFTPGAMISISAPGAEFPAFSANLTAPAPLAGLTLPTTVSRAAGYVATWTQATGQQLWIMIYAPVGTDQQVLLCKVPDTGSFTVPPAALAMFQASVTGVRVLIARIAETELHVGSDEVDIIAFDSPLPPTSPIPLTP